MDNIYFYKLKNYFFNKNFNIDLPLVLFIILLLILSQIILYSAGAENFKFIIKQSSRLLLATIIMIIIAQIPARFFYNWAVKIYFMSLALLIIVLILGTINKGAQRWLNIGIFKFQPAEIMKIGCPMMVAWYLHNKQLPPSLSTILISLLIIFVPTVLIIKQPDLGTAILICISGIAVLFLSGLPWRIIISFLISITIMLPIAWLGLHTYQKQRILTFLYPENDPLGAGYHIIQSKIAIGSGGIFGKGWLHGTQTHLQFLPEKTTDFIFAVFNEEFGLIGSIILFSIYFIIIIRGLYLSNLASNTFRRLLSGSIILIFFTYIFVNVGMVTGILPVVGLPLPLISFGGTSMLTIMVNFGILMSIVSNNNKPKNLY